MSVACASGNSTPLILLRLALFPSLLLCGHVPYSLTSRSHHRRVLHVSYQLPDWCECVWV
jgi:hypothetical protein